VCDSIGPGADLLPGRILRQPVAPVVVAMVGVPFGPNPVRLVHTYQLVEFDPQVCIANRAVLLPPVPAFPVDNPLRDPLPHILGIRGDVDFARLLEREEALNRGHQLHSVVGGVRVVPEEFLGDPGESQHARPSTRARINQVPQLLEDDGLNESQPAAAIPDLDPDDSAELPTPEEAAEDGEALLAVLNDPKLAGLSEDAE
jgi:hypothetical protein